MKALTPSRRRLGALALAATAMLTTQLALGATPVEAFVGYSDAPSVVFGSPGSGNGDFAGPGGVAVDGASGDVYVVDQGNERLEKFDAAGSYLAQITGAETPAGSFSTPRDVAVDNSSGPAKGDVYVTDTGHGVIDVFSPAGKYLSQITGAPTSFAGSLYGVAVDGSGNVWAYESAGNVDEFDAAGSLVKQFNTGRATTPGFAVDPGGEVYLLFGCGCVGKYDASGTPLAEWGGGGAALAVNDQSHDVFLDTSSSIEEYGPLGEPYGVPIDVFGSGSISAGGIAVNGATGVVYASRTESSTVAVFEPLLFPDVITGGASAVAGTSATLEGLVNPDGQAVASCEFEYGPNTAYGQTASCAPDPGSGASPVAVSAPLAGLTPLTTYHYRLVAANGNGRHYGSDGSFRTLAVAPAIDASQPPASTRVSATLGWTLNPENSETTYRVLYGTTPAYGEHTERGKLSGDSEDQIVLGLSGLAPETTYHYALEATNQAGITIGPDETLTTGPATPPTAVTGGASGVTLTAATVSGTIDPEGLETSYELDFGTDTGYGTSIYGEAGSADEPIEIPVELQNLAPGTTYHYRIVAVNNDGRTYGTDEIFTTPVYSNPIVLPSTLPLLATPQIAFPTETEPTQKPVKHKRAIKRKGKKHKHARKRARRRGGRGHR
jgi:DNA-binding beta-propeller fold protein YncE